ncbi:type II secretory pathway component PulM [Mesorhizobium robiniae]|uniref:Type II secretory pathway component PulM n=1 Tax=Mesorhizobium robiniae TaxID=559315 RepID=A0ABV2GPJ0_9HYPH
MPTSDNPPFPAALRLFSVGVIIVLIVGAGLFFAPVLVKPRWPWAVTPFNARFLGGFYTAEMVVMAALLVWNRWSPGRLVLVMAFIFTVIVSVASFINLDYFNFERKAPWLWFLVYLASVAVSGLFLWRNRGRPSAEGVILNAAWRGYMPVESAILGLYGVGLLLLPLTSSSFWPWPIDAFHAQLYSAIFLAGAGGVYLVWRSTPREELLVLALAQFLVGLLAILGIVITDAAVHRIDWTATGTLCWLALFGWIGISGAFKLYAASGAFSPQSAS